MFAKPPLIHAVCLGALLTSLACASTSTPSETPSTAELEKSERKAELVPTAAGAPSLAPVYFDTDSPLLRVDARKALKENAKAILEHPEWGAIAIEGHCDERGSEEYNLALGERRAAVVARYLIDLGVPAERLIEKTYGEARPAVMGSTEAAWQRNRRAELQRGQPGPARSAMP